MIVHMDLGLGDALICGECEEELSNDAWLLVERGNVDAILCWDCYQSLESKAKRGEE